MVEHSPIGIIGFDWRFCCGHGMTWGSSLVILPFVVLRPPELLVEGVEELVEWEIMMEKFEVKDVEFEENHVEVVRLAVNPPNSTTMGWTLIGSREVADTEAYDLAYSQAYEQV